MAMKTYTVIDEGDAFELSLFDGDLQVAGAILPFHLNEDEAHQLAVMLGESWGKPAGDGEVSSPYRPQQGKH